MNLVRPFLHTGMDFTGPLWIKRKAEDIKIYLLVFTCFNIRAIHVELLEDMSMKSFVLALVRFSNLYVIPKYLCSDNSRYFISSCNILNRFLNSAEYQDRFRIFQMKYLTIPLYST